MLCRLRRGKPGRTHGHGISAHHDSRQRSRGVAGLLRRQIRPGRGAARQQRKGPLHPGLPRCAGRRRECEEDAGAAAGADLQLGRGSLRRRAQFRPSRLRRRRHLRDVRQAAKGRGGHQPPAARRPHGVHPHARRDLDRADPKGRGAHARRALGVDGQRRRVVRRAGGAGAAQTTRRRGGNGPGWTRSGRRDKSEP